MESSSTEQSSSSESEGSVDSYPEETSDNFTSWSDTVFYEPLTDGSLEAWFKEKRPSNVLGNKYSEWLSVINPREKVEIYKRKWNRQSQTSQKIIDGVKLRQDTIGHKELLDTALKNHILRGYWMIFCNSNEELDKHWFYLINEFYNDERDLQYSRIECRKHNDKSPGGIILIINENFTDRQIISDLAKMCNKISVENDLDLGNMYYKLALYTNLGMYGSGSYILTSDAKSGLKYVENVEEWFENVESDHAN